MVAPPRISDPSPSAAPCRGAHSAARAGKRAPLGAFDRSGSSCRSRTCWTPSSGSPACCAPKERRELFRAMLEDVLSALAASAWPRRHPGGDPRSRGAPARRGLGARVLVEEAIGATPPPARSAPARWRGGCCRHAAAAGRHPAGHAGRHRSAAAGPRGGAGGDLAPSRDRRGSNAVVCSPPDLLPLRFGDDSFSRICIRPSLGIEPQIVERPGLALDVDTPEDLASVPRQPSADPGVRLPDRDRRAADEISRVGLLRRSARAGAAGPARRRGRGSGAGPGPGRGRRGG